jgi:2-dehydropantoate 2-reductase
VTTPDDAFQVAASAYTTLSDLPSAQTFDCAYLAMMAGVVVEAALEVLPLLGDDGYVVAFQNGFVEEAIGNAVGMDRVISATVAFGSTMEAPGRYRRTTLGRIIIGELDGRESARLEALRTTLTPVIETEISRNIVGVLWGKLIWNGAVSCLCAISGKLLGELFDSETGRELFLQSFRESVDAARAQGVTIEHVIVDPDDYYLGISDPPARRDEVLARLAPFVKKYTGVTPSTLVSLQRGRKSEIDFLNGYILEKARACGLAAPLNETVIRMVHDIEDGRRQIRPENLDELRDSLRRLI